MKTVVLIDGQNLFHLAQRAWGPSPPYGYPCYDVEKLAANLVARQPGRVVHQIRFYTGVHDAGRGLREAFWHQFWTNKLHPLAMKGVVVYKGRVNPSGQEKGVDVKLAVDLVELTYAQAYDAAIV